MIHNTQVLKPYRSKVNVIYIYIYICNHENHVSSQFPPRWLCGNSRVLAHDAWLYIAGSNKAESTQQVKQVKQIKLLNANSMISFITLIRSK